MGSDFVFAFIGVETLLWIWPQTTSFHCLSDSFGFLLVVGSLFRIFPFIQHIVSVYSPEYEEGPPSIPVCRPGSWGNKLKTLF
jgi:hypothetical protein